MPGGQNGCLALLYEKPPDSHQNNQILHKNNQIPGKIKIFLIKSLISGILILYSNIDMGHPPLWVFQVISFHLTLKDNAHFFLKNLHKFFLHYRFMR